MISVFDPPLGGGGGGGGNYLVKEATKKQMLDVSTSESIALWEARKFNLRYRMVGLSILFAIICNFLFLKDIAEKINFSLLYYVLY